MQMIVPRSRAVRPSGGQRLHGTRLRVKDFFADGGKYDIKYGTRRHDKVLRFAGAPVAGCRNNPTATATLRNGDQVWQRSGLIGNYGFLV